MSQQANAVCACIVASIAASAPAHAAAPQHCEPDTKTFITVSGTIHIVGSTVRPIIMPDGKADYSIFDTIDEYELSGPETICGPKALRVRFEYGDVRYAACAEGVPAKVSGFLERDAEDGTIFLRVLSPSDLICKPPD